MQTETVEEMKARWAKEREADLVAIELGRAYQSEQHGICYWDSCAGPHFRAGYEAGKAAAVRAQQPKEPA